MIGGFPPALSAEIRKLGYWRRFWWAASGSVSQTVMVPIIMASSIRAELLERILAFLSWTRLPIGDAYVFNENFVRSQLPLISSIEQTVMPAGLMPRRSRFG